MNHPFEHPASKPLIERVVQSFQSEAVYLVTDRKFLFVCGGPVDRDSGSIRARFLDYASAHLDGFRVFLAEAAARDVVEHGRPRFLNIAEFEQLLASIADCILIFPESPGSFSELGYFAANAEIRSRCIVANNLVYQAEESFINNGPIRLFDADSAFQPTILISYGDNPDFRPIGRRLESRAARRRERLRFHSFDDLDMKWKTAIVAELVHDLRIINIDGLMYVLRQGFGSPVEPEIIRGILSILVSTGYLSRVRGDLDFFAPAATELRLIEFDHFDTDRLAVEATDYYRRHAQYIYQLLGRAAA